MERFVNLNMSADDQKKALFLLDKLVSALFRERAQHTGLDHLRWLYARLQLVHHENPNVDYMLTFGDIILELEKIETELKIEPKVW